METDITLGDSPDFRIQVDAGTLDVRATDILLDAQHRRKSSKGHRRALVHDDGDALAVNFENDYPGGLYLNDAVVMVRQTKVFLDEGPTIAQLAGDGEHGLPEDAAVGQIVLRIVQRRRVDEPLFGKNQGRTIRNVGDPEASLWICVPPAATMDQSRTAWRQIELGAPVGSFRPVIGAPPGLFTPLKPKPPK